MKKSMNAIIVISLAGSLAACTSKPLLPPEISFDSDDFDAAVVSAEPRAPVEIVELPKPLPLPGQLKRKPRKHSAPGKDKRSPQERISAANKAAKMEPTRRGYINSIQVYPYAEGALYQLYTAPHQVSDIALQQGEKIVAVSAGDTVRWIIGDVVSGEGSKAKAHVLVKPIKEGMKTNLVIITDRRAYHLELASDTKTYMASVSWTYPRDSLIALRRQNKTAQKAAAQIIDKGLRIDQLKFRYAITSDSPAWRPVRVFDDKHKVYIQFPARLDQGEAPPLFVVGPRGENQLVNYRVRGNYYIVDRLFAAAELRLGKKPQQIVRITRTDRRSPKRYRRHTAFVMPGGDR